MQTRFTLTVPLARNGGEAVTDEEFAAIERDLLEFTDGFTATDGVGGWKHPDGLVFREPVRIYAVDTAAPEHVWPRLVSLAEFVATALEQEAVYLTRGPVQPMLVQRAVLR